MSWNPENVDAGLAELEPAASAIGLHRPFARARGLASNQVDWETDRVQCAWDRRFAFWRTVLSDSGTSWERYLDLAHPQVAETVDRFRPGGETSDAAWESCLKKRTRLPDLLGEAPIGYRRLFETGGWGLYAEDGTYEFGPAEGQLSGEVRQLDLEPVHVPTDEDYDWLVAHPRDRLFQNFHQSGYVLAPLALAHRYRPDDAWVRVWLRMVVSLIDQCPALPNAFCDAGRDDTPEVPSNVAWSHTGYVANRLSFLVAAYLLVMDSPAIRPRHHAVILRLIHCHADHLHRLGDAAYSDNYLVATAKALFLSAVLFPEFRASGEWLEQMWPRVIRGMRRELLGTARRCNSGYCRKVGRPNGKRRRVGSPTAGKASPPGCST